jgi:DNA polymerase I-like protein with 3'-5' exonuclease and polymerase domains
VGSLAPQPVEGAIAAPPQRPLLWKGKLSSMIMLQVHDEPLFEVPDVEAETTAKTAPQ